MMGRGSPSTEYSGNLRLRRLVLARRDEYLSNTSRADKHRIASEIIDTIHQRGGRFLQRITTMEEAERLRVPPRTQAWKVIRPSSPLLTKVKQLMRDVGEETQRKRRLRRHEKKRKAPKEISGSKHRKEGPAQNLFGDAYPKESPNNVGSANHAVRPETGQSVRSIQQDYSISQSTMNGFGEKTSQIFSLGTATVPSGTQSNALPHSTAQAISSILSCPQANQEAVHAFLNTGSVVDHTNSNNAAAVRNGISDAGQQPTQTQLELLLNAARQASNPPQPRIGQLQQFSIPNSNSPNTSGLNPVQLQLLQMLLQPQQQNALPGPSSLPYTAASPVAPQSLIQTSSTNTAPSINLLTWEILALIQNMLNQR